MKTEQTVKKKEKSTQKIVAFAEYMNFILDFLISNNVAYWKDVST